MKNPFVARGPVRIAEMFFGRTHELQELAAFLQGNQSVSLVGPRKIGKTSLIYHLMRPTTWPQVGLDESFLFVYLDCEVLGDSPHAEIFQQFAVEIGHALEERELPHEAALDRAIEYPTRLSFETAVRKFNQRGLRIVLILDEFERLSVNPHLNINFFNALRSAAGRYQLIFVTASQRPLIQLTYSGKSQEILSSPFFNIFAQRLLGLMPEQEARALINGTPHHFPPEFADAMLAYVGGHPFALQVVCFHAFAADNDWEQTKKRTMQELEAHYAYYWHNLSRLEKETISRLEEIMTSLPDDTTIRGVLRDLARKCLLVADGSRYHYVSEAWSQFVMTNHTTWVPREETMGTMTGMHVASYKFQHLLGRGGMSEVYKGVHRRLGREVAIKILPAELASEADFRARFEREAKAVAGLQHPNIVQIYDFGEEERIYYMVMEYIPGQTLRRLLQEFEQIPLPEAIPILSEIAAALDYAHTQGIVHRDVKPSNILLSTEDEDRMRAVLTDFGIAKIRAHNTTFTRPGDMLGTLSYISPEQIQNLNPVEKYADIYALGVVAFQMLTGQLPFIGGNSASLLMAHLNEPVPNPQQVNPQLPDHAASAIRQAMAKDPTQRFASAGDFILKLAKNSDTD